MERRMTRNLRILILILIGLGIFFAARLALYMSYADIFAKYQLKDIALAFIYGIRFDLSIFLTLTAFFWLLLLVPFYRPLYLKFVLWLMFFVYGIIALFLIVDVNYFGYVGRHFANEPFLLGNDLSFGINILSDNLLQLWGFLTGGVVAAFLWSQFVNISDKKVSMKKWAISSVLWLGFIFLLIRGGIGLKPISTIDAFSEGDAELGNLTLNGAFTSARFLSQNLFTDKDAYNFFDKNEAETIFLSSKSGSECSLPEDLVFEGKPNVVLILLESWSAYYVDFFGGKGFGITPNLDRLASQGIAFTRHYSPERRSISAIQAALTGIPPISGLPSLGFGLETMASGNVGGYFGSMGYYTIFVQSSMRRSFYMDAIAKSLGFKDYYGMEDITVELNYPDSKASVFGWDYETYNLFAEKLKEAGKPFFAFIFTGTTHVPYAPLPEQFMKFPHNTETEDGFKNTLYYADWSLGEFFKSIENEPWFTDTIFIITADHDLGKFENTEYPENFHVPFVIWSPKFTQGSVIDNVTSHIDITPTLLSLAGATAAADGYLGDSIFCKGSNGYAVLSEWNVAGIVEKDMFLRHSFGGILDYGPHDTPKERLKAAERLLLAYYQVAFGRVFNSRGGEK